MSKPFLTKDISFFTQQPTLLVYDHVYEIILDSEERGWSTPSRLVLMLCNKHNAKRQIAVNFIKTIPFELR